MGDDVEDRRHLKIENFVTTSSSSCSKLRDLNKKHALSYSNGKSKKKVGSKFSSVRFKSRRPSATTLVFGSGNQVHAGTKSYSQALLAHYTFITIISDLLGTKSTQAERFRIQNIVASCHYGYEIDLEKLSKERAEEFSWDPKLFPGARGKVQGLKTVTLLFSSGNGVITGAKTEEEIVRAFHRTYHIVKVCFYPKSSQFCDTFY